MSGPYTIRACDDLGADVTKGVVHGEHMTLAETLAWLDAHGEDGTTEIIDESDGLGACAWPLEMAGGAAACDCLRGSCPDCPEVLRALERGVAGLAEDIAAMRAEGQETARLAEAREELANERRLRGQAPRRSPRPRGILGREAPRSDVTAAGPIGTTADVVRLLALTQAERALLIEALDSHVYWQLSDESYRRDGHVVEPCTDDPEQRAEIAACRALSAKLAGGHLVGARKCSHGDCTMHCYTGETECIDHRPGGRAGTAEPHRGAPHWLTVRPTNQPSTTYRYDSREEAEKAGPRLALGLPRRGGYVALLGADPATTESMDLTVWHNPPEPDDGR